MSSSCDASGCGDPPTPGRLSPGPCICVSVALSNAGFAFCSAIGVKVALLPWWLSLLAALACVASIAGDVREAFR